MKNSQSIWCLHGNLQLPDVWEPFSDFLSWPLRAVDLFADGVPSMGQWVEQFCGHVATASAGRKQLLVGYSLGGRLAMQAVITAPELWQAVVVVSADPGHYAPEEKERQLRFDQGWGARFAREDWESLLAEWDSQGVFCGIPNPMKQKEKMFDRQRVAQVFDLFSKGRQADLSDGLARLATPPIMYISGALDEKYTGIGHQLDKTCDVMTRCSIPDAGHRVPWEKPAAWCDAVNSFLEER